MDRCPSARAARQDRLWTDAQVREPLANLRRQRLRGGDVAVALGSFVQVRLGDSTAIERPRVLGLDLQIGIEILEGFAKVALA